MVIKGIYFVITPFSLRTSEIAAVKGAYLQTAKLVERGKREHRAAYPCRLHSTQSAVSCAERGSERSRENQKERLQYLAAGTATPQKAGYGAITDRAAG